MNDPVYILIRTSNRPKFFKAMIETVKAQTYDNVIAIVHTDNPSDNYIEGDIIVRGVPQMSAGRGYYNLYNNVLLDAIPEGKGWYHFIDDDDMYASADVIERLVENSKRTHINVGRVRRWNDTVFPARWKNQNSYQTECFFLHTDHKKRALWWAKKGGDHYYSRQIVKQIPVNWIEDLLICKAQEGKGRGLKLDKGDTMPEKEPKQRISSVGKRLQNQEPIRVKYLSRVTGRYIQKGKKGEEKYIPKRYAEKLQKEGKVEIINTPFI